MDILVAETHSMDLMAYVYKLYQQQKACDVCLVSRDDIFYNAHVIVLTAASTYLHKLWSDNRLAESIRLDISSHVLQALIEFAYTGQLFVSASERSDTVGAARLLQMYSALDLLNTDSLKLSTQTTVTEVEQKQVLSSCYGDLSSLPADNKPQRRVSAVTVTEPGSTAFTETNTERRKCVGRPRRGQKGKVVHDVDQPPGVTVKQELLEEQPLVDQQHCDDLCVMSEVFDSDGAVGTDDTSGDPDFFPDLNNIFDHRKPIKRKSKRISTRLESQKTKPGKKSLKKSKQRSQGPYTQIKSVKGTVKIKISGLEIPGKKARKELKAAVVEQERHTRVFVSTMKDLCSCVTCGARFPAFALLRRHVILTHRNSCMDVILSRLLVSRATRYSIVSSCSVDSSKRIFTCNVCAKQFSWYSGFRRHFCDSHLKLVKHNRGMFSTVACKYETQRKFHMTGRKTEKILTKQTSPRPKQKPLTEIKKRRLKQCECPKCHKLFVSKATVVIHMKKMHTASNEDLVTVLGIKIPKRTVLKCELFQCPDCGKYMLSQVGLHTHLKTIHNYVDQEARRRQFCLAKPLDCEVALCPFQSVDLTLMKEHVRTSHPFIQHACSECSSMFQVKLDLERHHYKRHLVAGPCDHVCNVCDKRFPKSHRLRLHQFNKHGIKHEMLKVYHCEHDGCDYAATNPTTVRTHQRRHSKEKPFTCEFCKMKLKTAISHDKHVKKMHLGIRPFMCEVCGQSFGEDHELKSHHQNRHQTEHKFHCEYCPYATSNKGTFYTHLFNVHKARADDDNRKEFCCPPLSVCLDPAPPVPDPPQWTHEHTHLPLYPLPEVVHLVVNTPRP